MTSDQRQYLKSAIDAHRRAALAADGDVKFRHRPVKSSPEPMMVLATAAGVYGVLFLLAVVVSLVA